MTEYNITWEDATIAMKMGAICESQGIQYKALQNGKFKRRIRIITFPKTFKWIPINDEPSNPLLKWKIMYFINCCIKPLNEGHICATHNGYVMTNSDLIHYNDRKKLTDLMTSCCIVQTLKAIQEENNG